MTRTREENAFDEMTSAQLRQAELSALQSEGGFDRRELGTILAALRYWQRTALDVALPEDDIATDGAALDPLSEEEIDELCERINA